MATYRGRLSGKGKRFGIVVAKFNEFITRRLLASALETLGQAEVRRAGVDVVWVPGALEVPVFCRKLAEKRRYDALIALACVLRGDTHHFETVAAEVTRGIGQAALEFSLPIASGVITADTLEQAIDRAGLKAGNKGAQAALAALEIASLGRMLERRVARSRAKKRPARTKRKQAMAFL